MVVPVLVPKIVSGMGPSGLRSGKNGLGPDQTKLPQHYSERVVAVHLLTHQLHGRNDGGVVCHPSSLVEGVHDTIHSRNDGSDTSSVLGEKECCILVLLQKTVSSIWLMIYTDTHK